MPKKVNGIKLREFENKDDKKLFSVIKNLIENINYGSLELKLTIRKGVATNLKTKSEKSISIHND